MAWTELTDKRGRYSRTYQDGTAHRFEARLKTVLHYASTPDGPLDSTVDMTPEHVTAGGNDVWRIVNNGYHYALGQPADKLTDGWVGFGGRRGAHWFKFRLARVGYLRWSTRAWQDIGGTPDYTRAGRLTQQTDTVTVGPNNEQIVVQTTANWQNIFAFNGQPAHASWRVDGQRLKEEIALPLATVAEIKANFRPTTAATQTWFSFVCQVDWSDIPRRYIDGILTVADTDSSTAGEIALRDAEDRLLALLPIDYVIVRDPETGEELARQPLRRRLWRDADGNHYLLTGVRCDMLNALPAGDLIFDPTLTLDEGEAGADKDTMVNPFLNTRNFGAVAYMTISGLPIKGLIEFDVSSISADATCDSAAFYLYSQEQGSANDWVANAHSIASGNAAWIEGTGNGSANAGAGEPCFNALAADGSGGVTTAWAGSAGLGTSGTDYEATALGQLSGNRGDAVGTEYSTALTAARVEGWFGATNTNYGVVITTVSGNEHKFATSDHATASYRPKLVVVYTEAGGASGSPWYAYAQQ